MATVEPAAINNRRKRILIIGAVAGIGILYSLLIEKYFFEVNTFYIGDKESKQQIKLLFLSDLHFKKKLDPAYRKLAAKIKAIHPDLILIAGDVIDEDGIYAPAKEFFSLLPYSIPKVTIMGNHDHKNRVRMQTYKQLYEQSNCCLLMNESREYIIAGERLMVTGVDDFIEGHPSLATAVKDVGKEDNHVVLIHSPLQQEDILKDIVEINAGRPEERRLTIQYIFAGHNHGGQVCFFGFAPILPKKAGNYLKGWYNNKPPYLYLSKGFGTSTLPFRFGARSEVTVFYLGVRNAL